MFCKKFFEKIKILKYRVQNFQKIRVINNFVDYRSSIKIINGLYRRYFQVNLRKIMIIIDVKLVGMLYIIVKNIKIGIGLLL